MMHSLSPFSLAVFGFSGCVIFYFLLRFWFSCHSGHIAKFKMEQCLVLCFLVVIDLTWTLESGHIPHAWELRLPCDSVTHLHTVWASLVFLVSFPVFHHMDQHWLRELRPLRRAGRPGPQHHSQFSLEPSSTKKQKALARELLVAIENLSWVTTSHPFTYALYWRRRMRLLRGNVHRLLSAAVQWGNQTIDALLLGANVPRLLATCSDEVVRLIQEQSLLLPPLSMSIEAKAAIIDAIQKEGSMRAGTEKQEWATQIFLSCSGMDLVLLKNMLDGGGDYHSLHKLVFKDMWSPPHRARVLDHFQREAMLTLPSRDRHLSDKLKILSDIDDTLYCSGGHFPKGVDTRYPAHAVYPGILELFMQMDVQRKAMKRSEDLGSYADFYQCGGSFYGQQHLHEYFCNLVLLSARPHIYKDISERAVYRSFRQLYTEGELNIMPVLLPGRLCSSLCGALRTVTKCSGAWHSSGLQKFRNLSEFKQLYPESTMVFFGDSGQGDVVTAEMAASTDPPLIRAAFINEVRPRARALTTLEGLTPEQRDARWLEMRIYWVRTPVRAALYAMQEGLLNEYGLLMVCQAAKEDLEVLAVHSSGFPDWQQRCEEMNVDLQEANEVLRRGEQGAQVEFLDVADFSREQLTTLHPPSFQSRMSTMSEDARRPLRASSATACPSRSRNAHGAGQGVADRPVSAFM